MKKQIVVLVLAAVLVFGCAVGGTLAWLMDKTQTVTNTFTYGDINITLAESDADGDSNANVNSYKMLPGATITKDPVVTVKKDSEACWLFVKVEKSANWPAYITYAMADGWTLVEDTTDVYVRSVANNKVEDQPFQVIKNNTVTISNTVDKATLTALGNNFPQMTIIAYAVQADAANTAAAAWAVANNATGQ